MTFFDDAKAGGLGIFKNENALDPEWVPKILPYREGQQREIAACIKPLMQGRTGRNAVVYGAPGIGKTAATRWVLRDLEENAPEVYLAYINCWQKNTTFKILIEICHQIGYSFTQNKGTEELFEVIKGVINKKDRSAVFVFDEIDKVADFDFMYSILNDIFKKTIILITNYKEWVDVLEDRIMSRLLPEMLEFKAYNTEETLGIMRERLAYAFVPDVWPEESFSAISKKTAEAGDLRLGLYLLREAGMAAEDAGSKRISSEHVQKAISKTDKFTTKNPDELEEDTQMVLEICRENSGGKIGDIYEKYKEKGGTAAYKTFQRRIEKLSKNSFIQTEKITGGKEGTTTVITVSQQKPKKLTEF
jgi:cell division control protein 6